VNAPVPASSLTVTATDGLKLHVRRHRPAAPQGLPIVCLPGLARTGADFDVLAETLAGNAQRPRTVVALDYRGRGRSDHDPDPANYSLAVELADVLTVLDSLGIDRAVVIGTSRGGLLGMLLGSVRPAQLAGLILNDIGPVLEAAGLQRIRGYVGKLPQPTSIEHGADILQDLFASQFPLLTREAWRAAATRMWEDHQGRLVPTYDVKLAQALATYDPTKPLAVMWDEYDRLAGIPLMVIRGTLSDLLSAETVAAMRARRPDLVTLEVPDQGHAPLLAESDVIGRIANFVAGCEARPDRA
jgi:pimeloyl-ACP methyl ester carboxylesterase